MNELQAREEICRVGRSLFDRGYVHATAGNLSVKLDDGYLITPTDACMGNLDPTFLSKVDARGNLVAGGQPSKTLLLHQKIIAAAAQYDPQTRCVLHTHSTHCVALSFEEVAELVPALTPYFVMKVGHVPQIAYNRPGAPDAADAVVAAIDAYGHSRKPIRAVILRRLGPVVWHRTPAEAMAVLEELEKTARLRFMLPEKLPLPEADIEQLRHQFGARW